MKSFWIKTRYFVLWQKYLTSVRTHCRFLNNACTAGIVGILTPS